MQTICQVDASSLWTGKTDTIDDDATVPFGWVAIDAPTLTTGQGASLTAGAWRILDVNENTAVVMPGLVASTLAALGGLALAKLAVGYATGGLHVAVDDGSRANLSGMGSTAGFVISGTIQAWPDNYARGWISMEGARIALPTAQDGLALATGAGNFYSAVVQHAQDLEETILAATTVAELEAIDVTAGWPA